MRAEEPQEPRAKSHDSTSHDVVDISAWITMYLDFYSYYGWVAILPKHVFLHTRHPKPSLLNSTISVTRLWRPQNRRRGQSCKRSFGQVSKKANRVKKGHNCYFLSNWNGTHLLKCRSRKILNEFVIGF